VTIAVRTFPSTPGFYGPPRHTPTRWRGSSSFTAAGTAAGASTGWPPSCGLAATSSKRPTCRATTRHSISSTYARLIGAQPDAVVVGHSRAGQTIGHCTRADADWAFPQLRPQTFFDEAVAPFGRDDVVLVARPDGVVDPAWQVRTGRAYGARVEELDTGHFLMLTHPRELADHLVRLSG
jgi:hypothetical protein